MVEYYGSNINVWSPDGLRMAEEIADELADQALAAEVPETIVIRVLKGVPYLNDKRALRNRLTDLMGELTEHLVQYTLVNFEEQLCCFLEDLRAMPTDVF